MIKKVLLACLSLATVTALVVYYGANWFIQSPAALESGTIESEEIGRQVHIERLGNGLSQITADDKTDALFGMGFAHARDHLWQMQVGRLVMDGKISSHFGNIFKDADLLGILLSQSGSGSGISDESRQLMEWLDAYARGINAFIRESGNKYPIEFTLTGIKPEFWTASDVIRYDRLMQWLTQNSWRDELTHQIINTHLPASLIPYLIEEENRHEIFTGDEQAAMWILEADFKLRKVLSAPLELPVARYAQSENGDFYIMHQSGTSRDGFWAPVKVQTGNTDVYGITIPGIPVIWSGMSGETRWNLRDNHFKPVIFEAGEEPEINEPRFRNLVISLQDGYETLEKVAVSDGNFRLERFPDTRFLLPDQDTPDRFASRVLTAVVEQIQASPFSNLQKKGPGKQYSDHHLASLDFILAGSADDPENLTVPFSEAISDSSAAAPVGMLVEILAGYINIPEIETAATYFINWDFRYTQASVASSLLEGYLHYASRAAVRTYVPDDIFSRLDQIDLIPNTYALGLTRSHYLSTQDTTRFTPVNDGFIVRRVIEAVSSLEERFGPESHEWRWGKLNVHQPTDYLLCTDFGSGLKAGNSVCRYTIGRTSLPIQGNRHTPFASRFTFTGDEAIQDITGAFLHANRQNEIVSIGAGLTQFLNQEWITSAADRQTPDNPVLTIISEP